MQPANLQPSRILGALLALSCATALASLALARDSGASPEPSLTLFFTSERLSQIEPCGCVRKQLGGVQYERVLYDGSPRASSLRVDAGGFTSRIRHPEDAMRTRYALEAMATGLDLDAVNVAARDLEMGRNWFATVDEQLPEASERMVSANIYHDQTFQERAFQPYRLVERELTDGTSIRALITGIASAEGVRGSGGGTSGTGVSADQVPGYFIRPPADALAEILETAPEHDFTLVLAYAGEEAIREASDGAHTIDCIIRASGSSSRTTVQREKAKPSPDDVSATPVLEHQGSEGKILGRARAVREADGSWRIAAEPEWLEISPDLKPVPALVELIEAYKQNTQELMIQQPKGLERVYAGARACASCHTAEYEQWSETRHAHALDTLVSKGMQYDSRCLKCHTVGFARENGFYNVRESMLMAGVQCESCHGPAAEHANLQYYLRSREGLDDTSETFMERKRRAAEVLPSREVEAKTCIECHTPENDDHFVYDEKVVKVNHRGSG